MQEILPPVPAVKVKLPDPSIVLAKEIGCEEVVRLAAPEVERAEAIEIELVVELRAPLRTIGPVPI